MANPEFYSTVQEFYVAYYGRWADVEGRDYWSEVLADAGGDPTQMINAFGQSDEFRTTYDAYLNDDDEIIDAAGLIHEIFRNMFGRDADPDGLEFYADLLESGESTLAEIALDVYNGATGTDLAVLTNKVSVAGLTTDSLVRLGIDYTADDIVDARNVLGMVTDDPASVVLAQDAALAVLVSDSGLSSTFVLKEVEPWLDPVPDATLMWGYTPGEEGRDGIEAQDLLDFLDKIVNIDFAELGLIDDDGVSNLEAVEAITNITLNLGEASSSNESDGNIENNDNATAGQESGAENNVTITFDDGTVVSAEAALGEDYLNFLSDLLFDADGNSRLYYDYDDPDQDWAIVLTTTENNGGTVEWGLTSDADDHIIAGRLELLHGAYIDGGEGVNTLDIDAKGTYAQPLLLSNIQHISIQNLPNVYDNDPDVPSSYEDLSDLGGTGDGQYDLHPDSIVDLSRAADLETLSITEGWDNYPRHEGADEPGNLSVVGIPNGVPVALTGGFGGDLYLHYGRDQGSAITVELDLGDTEGFGLHVAQNTNTLNLVSNGYENWLESAWFGGNLRTLNISGEGPLYIEGDLGGQMAYEPDLDPETGDPLETGQWVEIDPPSFRDGRPATIDASANTGGVELTLNDHGLDRSDVVEFIGSDAGDSFTSMWSEAVEIDGGEGDNVFNADGSRYVHITSGAGDDRISAAGHDRILADSPEPGRGSPSEEVMIDAGDGDNQVIAGAEEVAITTGAGADEVTAFGEEVTVSTGAGDDALTLAGFPHADNAKVTIDMGAGSDRLAIGDKDAEVAHTDVPFTALDGSSITGESIALDIDVDQRVDLSRAALSGIVTVELEGEIRDANNIDDDGTLAIADRSGLVITAAQLAALGAGAFSVSGGSFGEVQDLIVVVTEDVTLSELIDVAELSRNVRLSFEIRNGATLTLTAEELHTYVSVDGIDSTDGLDGKVVIADAGLTFDAFNDEGSAVVIPGGPAVLAGSLTDNFDASEDVTIIRTYGGFERPEPDESTDTLTIDSDVTPVIDESIETNAKTLEIVGSADLDMIEAPVTLDSNNFNVDFSALTGALSGLTLVDFQRITAATDHEDWGEVIGNGTAEAPARIDVELDGNVATEAHGLMTSGVQTYVVTDLNGADRAFWSSEPTMDVETLGLQGNQGYTITFGDVKWGVEFLLEGDGAADWEGLPKAYGNPNLSNVGTLIGDFFTPGADAVVNITNQGTTLGLASDGAPRPLAIDGIQLDNADSVTINIADGNAIIANLQADTAEAITVTGEAGVALWLDGISAELTQIDATGVAGAATIGIGKAPDDMTDFSFAPDDFLPAVVDLSGVDMSDPAGPTVSSVDAVLLADSSELTLNADQVVALGEANILSTNDGLVGSGDDSTLNVNGLAEQAIDFTAIGVDNIGAVTTADVDGVITISPETVFGNAIDAVDSLTIAIETSDTTVEMTAAQFQQLDDEAPAVDATDAGIDAGTGKPFEATLVLTDLAPDEQLDLTGVRGVNQVIRIDGLVAEGDDPDTAEIEGMVINALPGAVTIDVAGGDNDLSHALLGGSVDQVDFSVLATGTGTLTLTADQVELIGVENFSAAEGSDVTLNIVDLDGDNVLDLDVIADAGINIGTVSIEDTNAMVTLAADTTLGGADEIVTPSWDADDETPGVEDTKLTMTAAQFNGSAGIITGDALVNITDLKDNRDGDDADQDVDYTTIDLSGVTAPNGTISLWDDPDTDETDVVTLAGDDAPEGAADLAGFSVTLGDGQLIRFATEVQAGREVHVESGDTAGVQWLWATFGAEVDTSGYDGDLTTLFIDEALLSSQPREEDLWTTLDGGIIVEKINGDTIPELAKFERINTFEAYANIPEGINYDDDDSFSTVTKLTMNLEGGVNLGNILLGDTNNGDGTTPYIDGKGFFEALVINSYLDLSTDNDTVPGVTNEVNTIGDIGLNPETVDDLVDVTISTAPYLDPINVNGEEALRDGLAIEVGTISFGANEAKEATLTLTGPEDISLAGVDITDAEISLLTIDANAHSGDLEIGGIDPEGGLDDFGKIYVLDGHTAEDGDAFGMVMTDDLLVITNGDNDLTEATLDIEAVHVTGDATLTLTAEQVADIGVENFSVAAGAKVTLDIVDVANDFDLDLNAIQDAGVNIGTLTLIDGTSDVTFVQSATLGGADEIVTPTADVDDAGDDDGLEDTVFTLTAAQFNQLSAGLISGDAQVRITDLMNNIDTDGDYDLDMAAIDLSTIAAPNGTISLGEPSVTLTGADAPEGAADLAGFSVVLDDNQMIRFATEEQAITKVDVLAGANPTAVVWLFDTITSTVDLGGFGDFAYNADTDTGDHITTLFISEELLESVGGDEESLWSYLAGEIVVEKVTDGEFPDVLIPVDRTNTFQAFANIESLSFDDLNPLQTTREVTLNLEGQVTIGELVIGDTSVADGEDSIFEKLVINSYFDPDTLEGTEADSFVPLPNEIGNISLAPTTVDELVNVELHTYEDADPDTGDGFLDGVNVNAGEEWRDGLALKVGTIIFGAETEKAASLIITGANDVTIEAVDITDAEISLLTINADAHSGDLEIGGIEPEDGLNGFGLIEVLDGYDGDDTLGDVADGAEADDLLVITNGDNDLTEATLDIEAVHVTGDATLTLTAEQITEIGEGNFSVDDGVTVTLNVTELGEATIDLNTIQDAGFNIGVVSTVVDSVASGSVDTVLAGTTTLGGADEVRVLLNDENNSLTLTATQYEEINAGNITELDSDGTTENAAAVTITDTIDIAVDTDDDGFVDTVEGLDLSTVLVSGNRRIEIADSDTPADLTFDDASDLGDYFSEAGGFAVVLDSQGVTLNDLAGQTVRFSTAAQADRAIDVINDAGPDDNGTNVVWLFTEIDGTSTAGKVNTSLYDFELGRVWMTEELVRDQNVENLFTDLSATTIIRVVNADELDELLLAVGFNRNIEIESYTDLTDGGTENGNLTFNDIDQAGGRPIDFVQNLVLDLGGDVTMGAIEVDNVLADPIDNDDEFDTLTINSYLAAGPGSSAEYLLPELPPGTFYGALPGNVPYPDGANEVGDIRSGSDEFDLGRVVINTDNWPVDGTSNGLVAGTITFSDDGDKLIDGTSMARFTVNGNGDVTIKSLDTSDADVTGLTVTHNGGGTLTVTGGSPAFDGGDATGETESLTIAGSGDVNLGWDPTANDGAGDFYRDASDNPYAGVAGADLSDVNVTTTGAVNLGVIALVDSEDFTLTDTVENAQTTFVLGEANVSGAQRAPELSATGSWTFTGTAASRLQMTITEDVTFNAGGTLTLGDVDLTFDGDVDLTMLVDDPATTGQVEGFHFGDGAIKIPNGASLTLTAEQVSGTHFEGEGTLRIVGDQGGGDDFGDVYVANVDLSGMTSAVDFAPNRDAIDDKGEATSFNIIGSPNNDVINLSAGSGNDTITGGSGSDTLTGGAGDDTLDGGAGNDTLTGGAGDDTLDGGAGDDTLDGGAGSDTYRIGAGSDTITSLSADGADELGDDDVIIATAGTATANVETMFIATPDTSVTAGATVTLNGTVEDDRIDVSAAVGAGGFTLNGGSGADQLTGSANADTINGGDGDDTIHGFAGADTVDGGNGSDTLVLTADLAALADNQLVDVEQVTAEDATAGVIINLSSQTEGLSIEGSSGADTITGGSGNDDIVGGSGADTLNGGAGNDNLDGGSGDDVLNGGAGDDVLSGGDGVDTLNGGSGSDWIVGGSGDDVLNGGAGDDVLSGGDGVDTLDGGSGDDLIDDAEHQDQVIGGAGNDTARYGAGFTAAELADSDLQTVETIVITNADDAAYDFSAQTEGLSITGNSGADTITGGAGDDTIDGDGGDDILSGGAGNDTLAGGSGADMLMGGAGNDILVADQTDALIDGGDGDDTVRFGAAVSAANLEDADLVGVEHVEITNAGAATYSFSAQTEGLSITGNSGADNITGGAGDDTIDGDLGNDILSGGSGADTLMGGAGNDLLIGGSGADTLTGGAGNDALSGGAGDDTIDGDLGDDILSGGAGDDTLTGGSGNDTLSGGSGNDTFVIDAGSDTVTDVEGGDTLQVSAGATAQFNLTEDFFATNSDTNFGIATISMVGTASFLSMSNADGSEGWTLVGSNGNDDIRGSSNNDVIVGGQGQDDLTGNGGDDVFTYNLLDLNELGDEIEDFESAGDQVALEGSEFLLGVGGAISDQGTGTVSSLVASAASVTALNFTAATGPFAILFIDTTGADAGLYYQAGNNAAGNITSADIGANILIAEIGGPVVASDIVLI